MAEESEDEELEAIRTVLRVLTPLQPDGRNNVIEYVFRRLGITIRGAVQAPSPSAAPTSAETVMDLRPTSSVSAVSDLRSLTQEKRPKSANQMVAVLAYYLENLAPTDQRRDHIVADDIKKYFPQANFPLPTGPARMTLSNAKNAGYLDGRGSGEYKLNPVGHNLVVHRLPGDSGLATGPGLRRPKKAAKKPKQARK